jgi:hypothetical protein
MKHIVIGAKSFWVLDVKPSQLNPRPCRCALVGWPDRPRGGPSKVRVGRHGPIVPRPLCPERQTFARTSQLVREVPLTVIHGSDPARREMAESRPTASQQPKSGSGQASAARASFPSRYGIVAWNAVSVSRALRAVPRAAARFRPGPRDRAVNSSYPRLPLCLGADHITATPDGHGMRGFEATNGMV